MNIADGLDRNASFFPENEALVDGERRWTYVDYRRDADRFAHALTELGVGKGDRVALYLGNSAEFAIAFYGILKVGAVVVSISSMSKRGEVEYMANHSEAVVLVAGAGLMGEVPEASAMPLVRHVVGVGAHERADAEFWKLLEGCPERFETIYTDRQDPAEIIYTSGTTGKPKGVVLSHANVVSNTATTVSMCDMKPEDRHICFLPMYHSFAQNFIFNGSVVCGSTLVIMPKFQLEAVLARMKAERVTRWYAVPTIYILALGAGQEADEAFASVRFCFSAAATMPAEVARKWGERFGLKINEGYGLTESTPSAVYNHRHRHKQGSVGTPIENVEVQIWDEDHRPLPPGGVGEIVIKGPNVMLGYHNDPEATAQTIIDGWLRTGDVGSMDDEGYLYIVDRIKDMVNSAGLKIWPREVEEVLYEHFGVKECAIIGVPDPLYGESVKACIVLKPGVELCEEDIISYCKGRMAGYKAPKMVEFLEALPKNATGKILKSELRSMAETAGQKP